jgi:hypothetical protein
MLQAITIAAVVGSRQRMLIGGLGVGHLARSFSLL